TIQTPATAAATTGSESAARSERPKLEVPAAASAASFPAKKLKPTEAAGIRTEEYSVRPAASQRPKAGGRRHGRQEDRRSQCGLVQGHLGSSSRNPPQGDGRLRTRRVHEQI